MKKKILITGAGGNLGESCVHKFLKEGHHVIATVSPGKKLGYAASGEISIYDADLASETASNIFFRKLLAEHPVIDAALLLVGGFAMGKLTDTDMALMDKMLHLNFYSAYFPARNLVRQMQNQKTGGNIIFVASKTALEPSAGKGSVAYTLSKAMLLPLAQMINADGTGKNVKAFVIAPGTIDTESNRKDMPDADFSKWVKAEEIADTIGFLIGDSARVLNNDVLKVYGR